MRTLSKILGLVLFLASPLLAQPPGPPISPGSSGGSGNVTASGSEVCTDNQLLRANGTAPTAIQCSPLVVSDTTGNLTGPSGGFSIIGGTGATDDLVLDGSAGTAGSVVVTETGQLQPSGGTIIRTGQVIANNIAFQVGSLASGYFNVGNDSLDSALSTTGFISVLGTNVSFYTTDTGIEFEGASKDGYEIVLTSEDATADRVVRAPDASGTLMLRQGIGKTYSMGDASAVNLFAVTLANADTGCSLQMAFSYFVTDGTDTAVHSGEATWAITNDDGTVTGTAVESGETVNGVGCAAGCDTFSGAAVSTVYTATAAFNNTLSATGSLQYNVLFTTCAAVSFSP